MRRASRRCATTERRVAAPSRCSSENAPIARQVRESRVVSSTRTPPFVPRREPRPDYPSPLHRAELETNRRYRLVADQSGGTGRLRTRIESAVTQPNPAAIDSRCKRPPHATRPRTCANAALNNTNVVAITNAEPRE